MATLSVQDIATRVQRMFGDDDYSQLLFTDIVSWINDAMREIVQQNDLLQVSATAAAVAGQSQYAFPSNLMKLRRVAYQGYALRPISVEEANETVEGANLTVDQGYPVGTPTHYWVFAGMINLYPAPISSGAADINLQYNRYPIDIANPTDVPELSAMYSNRIVEYCTGKAFELDTNLNLANLKNSQFQSGLDKMKGDQDWESKDQYPTITVQTEYPYDAVGDWC